MSFPPHRPPMGMPMNHMGMAGYGYPPVGMMPMPMGMMPMMRQAVPTMTTSATMNTNTNSSHHKINKKLVPQEIPKSDKKDEKPPVTTVFVGNISDRAPDAMIRQMLQRCGNVLSWKRVQGASGKLQAFGFCEYEEPEATLRCIRLLNEWQISDKKLVVKVDAKTKALLDDYKTKKQKREGDKAKETDDDKEDKDREEGEVKENDKREGASDDLDEFTLREDRVAKAGLDAIMREYANDLAKKPPPEYSSEEKKEHMKKKKKESEQIKDSGLDDMELEDDKKELINKEIRSFRDAHKDEEEKEKAWEKEREQLRRKREEDRDRERDRQREKEKRERKERERMIKDRSKTRSRSRSRSRSRERDRNIDEEDDHERRKLERKLREKESAYQELLKKWEARERKKTREYEKEQDREEDRKSEEVREARRLKEFLEDYDDERDDHKYYKGSALQRRLKEREKEMEADERDRQREREEIEDIRRRLLEKGHPDPEGEMARIERERDEHLMPRLHKIIVENPPTPEPEPEPEPEEKLPSKMQPTLIPIEPANTVSSQSSAESDTENLNIDLPSDSSDGGPSPLQTYDEEPFIGPAFQQEEPEKEPIKPDFTEIKNGNSNDSPTDHPSKRKMTVKEVFNQDEEETSAHTKKRKLIPLDYSEEEKAALTQSSIPPLTKPTTAEEKRRCIKNLIEKIPTAKEELFAYTLDWTMVDGTLMDRRIKPWVNKKIVEYIGEEEPTLTDFICQKVMAHSTPQMILGDVAMVLDEEAEVFVVKMWRLLIYEAEAKKLGLVK